MNIQVRQDITTTVPTSSLIEIYQDLMRAIEYQDWSLAQIVADSVSDTISDYTKVPEDLNIKPSGSSLIDMSNESGIILGADGQDIKCVAGMAVSEAICGGGCCECNVECQSENDCDPGLGRIRLGEGSDEVFDSANPAVSLLMLKRLGEKAGRRQGQ